MVLLTTVLMPLSVLASWHYITDRERGFYALMLTLLTGLVGVFIALDLFLFYVFFEVMLIPMYFIIGIWGGDQPALRGHQVLHLHHGRLAADAGGHRRHGLEGRGASPATLSFAYEHLLQNAGGGRHRGALAVRGLRARVRHQGADLPVPHLAARRPRRGADGGQRPAGRRACSRSAPTASSALPCRSFPQVALSPGVSRLMVTLAVIGIIYGALVAMVQPDIKKLVAYSSVSHLGFVMLGIWGVHACRACRAP